MLIPASLTPPSTTPCELRLDVSGLHQQTTLQSSQASKLLSFVATLSVAPCAMEPGHLLYSVLSRPSRANAWRLNSRHLFVPAVQHLISSSNNNICAAQWADHQWNAEWLDNPTRLRIFIPDTGTHIPRITLPRRAWVRLNCLHTGVGHFRSYLYKWDMASSASCECGAEEQPLSSHVQSINLPMDCMAWQFRTMRLLNGCSKSAPRSGVAKQWFEQLAQKKKQQYKKTAFFKEILLINSFQNFINVIYRSMWNKGTLHLEEWSLAFWRT